jgi:uncharacterized protein (DUF2252 family)
MVTRDVVDRIVQFNADRPKDGQMIKYRRMAASAFDFFRGTCHLFYEDFPHTDWTIAAPLTWSCGDLHLQNFGTYKGDDRQVYFDINDFDEAMLAPCSWDGVRWLTSLWVAAQDLGLPRSSIQQLGQHFLNVYAEALSDAKARAIHSDTAKGIVQHLLEDLQTRKRRDLLDDHTEKSGQQLRHIEGKTVAIDPAEQRQVTAMIDHWAQSQKNPDRYQVLDVVHRIAGNSSLGQSRYLILVEGKGSPDKNYLLDLKAARTAAIAPYLPAPIQAQQPTWPTNADRITTIQSRCQPFPPNLLHAIPAGQQSYVLRELQPSADKIAMADLQDRPPHKQTTAWKDLIHTMAQVLAWGQLRSSGHQGSATTDQLVNFAAAPWQNDWLSYAEHYSQQVRQDYQIFRQAVDRDGVNPR